MNNQTDQISSKHMTRRSAFLSIGLTALAVSFPPRIDARAAQNADAEHQDGERMVVGMVVFDGFQLLDVFGPLEMFGALRDRVRIILIADRTGVITSSAGPSVNADYAFANVPKLDILLIPGGAGTRREVKNESFLADVKALSITTPSVASICTGAAILARTGLLDGLRATTNKRAFNWATGQGPYVNWVKQARWVEDGKYFTSSGISAGTDMALAMIAKQFGHATAQRVADGAEYHWNSDPNVDPFAKLNGLTD